MAILYTLLLICFLVLVPIFSPGVISILEAADSSASGNTARLMDCYSRFASLQNQNSIRWAQLAHLLWLKDGDQNTIFSITLSVFVLIITTFLKFMTQVAPLFLLSMLFSLVLLIFIPICGLIILMITF